jgi:hypothetical protein
MQVKLAAELGRIPILDVTPVVGCGRWPAKAVVGETVEVSATVFREGHERLGAAVVLRTPEGEENQLDGTTSTWRRSNCVRLDPHTRPAHVFTFQENGGHVRASGERSREANRIRRR